QLNHSNYSEWAVHMEAILIKLGFWDLVIWDGLAAVHQVHSFSSHLHIHRKFIIAIMKEGQGIESWIGEVCTLSNKLKLIDVPVTDKDVIVVIMAGLPDSYSSVVIVFDNVDSKILTLDFIITCLLNEEGRQDKPAVAEVKKE
ncbi:hypothetical protein L208DRAFT_1150460, partial [Tricholoma matsutake]